MCGRYYVDDDTAREIEKLVRQVAEVGIPRFSWNVAHIQCQKRIRAGEKDVPGERVAAVDCSASYMVL